MSAGTLKSLQYRSFDQLLGAIQVDFASYNAENSIEPAELIKIAQKCNYQLGLKINQTKETVLEVEHGRVKLPSDFYQLNLALLCNHYDITYPSLTSNLQQHVVMTSHTAPNLTTCPCWTVTCTAIVQVPVTHCDRSTEVITFPVGVSKVCAINIDISNTPLGTCTIATSSFCYHDTATGDNTCAQPLCNTCSASPCTCGCINPDPWFQDRVYTICDGSVGIQVVQECRTETRTFTEFSKLYMVPAKEATAFCLNSQFRDCSYTGQIKDGFIQLNVDCGKVYICYEGAMENEQGELLVLDHPLINEFYEWSLKYRILSNLYLNGEPDIERRLAMCKEELRVARIQAMSITAMPDYRDVVMAIDGRRSEMYNRFTKPFERLWAPWSTNGYNLYNR